MQFNITFKTIFEYVLKKLVLCIQIRFVSTEKTTRIASRASCYNNKLHTNLTTFEPYSMHYGEVSGFTEVSETVKDMTCVHDLCA